MPRINIDDSLTFKAGFQDLMIKLGNKDMAYGVIYRAFALAQKYWHPERKPIPLEEWKKEGMCDYIIDFNLADLSENGVYMHDSEKQFAWLFQKSEAGKKGGIASAKSRAKGSLKQTKRSSSVASPEPSVAQAEGSGANPPSPSPSYSLLSTSSSLIHSSIASNSKSTVAPRDAVAYATSVDESTVRSPMGFFIARYAKAFQAKYGDKSRPSLTGKDQGNIKRFLSETNLDRACDLIETYCQMNDAWFLTKGHDFGTFIENLSKVGLALDTGKHITQTEARMTDQRQSTVNAFMRVAREMGIDHE
jgi:hypothetical protein